MIVWIGSGYNYVDVKAAGELGIAVCNILSAAVKETADPTVCHILNLYRRNTWLYQVLREGTVVQSVSRSGRLPRVGGGVRTSVGRHWASLASVAMGQAVAVRAKAFGFSVLFYNLYLQDGTERSLGM